jgi:subtilase family serine protease
MHLFAHISSAKTRSLFSSRPLLGTSLAALGLLGVLGHSPARAGAPEPRVALSGTAAPAARLREAHLLGRLAANTTLRAGLVLPLRNQSELAELVRRQYTPGDSLFHHFLSPPDFTARFGPTAEDYAAVAAYAHAQGLTVTGTSPGRTLLNVTGPSARIEAAFGVQMSRYSLPNGRVVFANSAAPTLPRSVAARLAGIAGLNNIAVMHPYLKHLRPNAPVPITGGGGSGSGPLGGLSPNDIKYAYDLSTITPLYGATTATVTTAGTTALDGTGQNIGLFELDGYNPADIALYTSQFALPTVLTGTKASLTVVPLGGFLQVPLTVEGQSEVTLDIDMILALAPKATGIYVYEDNGVLPDDPTFDAAAPITIFTQMVNERNPNDSNRPLLQVISCSWGIAESLEDPTVLQAENALFQTMAAQGQSLFCSSGDNGAYDLYTTITDGTVATATGVTTPEVDNPSSQPFATGVGGTTLSYVMPSTNATTGVVSPGTYVGETTWSAGTAAVDPEGSGGGISSLWSKPAYQAGFGAAPTRRDVPDVSLNADPNTGYTIYAPDPTTGTPDSAGVAQVVGGTSASAPLWAAYTSLINQQRTANGLTTTLGFLNPLLYPLAASSSSYNADFHDITTGSNLFYQAGTGYDDATGLGSFVGAPLLAALSFNANQGTGSTTLTGTITDTSTPPVPIAGAAVTATTTTNNAVVATATTDSTGTYTLSVPSGLVLKITVTTTAITAPLTENFTGTSVTLAALTAGTPAMQNFILTPAVLYAPGLQMISAPYDYTGIAAFPAVFGLTAAQANVSPRLIQFSPLINSYVFYPTGPADTLRLGQGYWIRFPSASSSGNYLHISGTPALTTQSFSISLQQGWNQIGDPFFLSVPLSSITATAGTGQSGPLASTPAVVQPTLYSFDTTTNAYNALNPASDSLNPYIGYWIFAFQSCTLSVPVPAGTSTLPPGVPLGG